MTDKPKRHRHEASSWFICGGYVEWCYQCGAWRQMEPTDNINGIQPISAWHKPTGIGGPNPVMKTTKDS